MSGETHQSQPITRIVTESWVGQTLNETYRVVRKIGSGGMGAVYEADHVRVRRKFAIKLLSGTSFDEETLKRFAREAEITSSLLHPNIVEVIDYNQVGEGVPYMVMELLRGEDLSTRLKTRGPYRDVRQVLQVLRQAVSGLAVAHQQGVIHRDLKPRNLFLCERADSDEEFVKILDFGVSKVLGAHTSLTQTGEFLGSPSYMAPEQLDGKPDDIDQRTDVFALAAIAFEMLTGRPPFLGNSPAGLVYKIVHGEPDSLCAIRPDLPRTVESAINRSLAKQRDDRHQSPQAFLNDLERSVGGELGANHEMPSFSTIGAHETSRTKRNVGFIVGVLAIAMIGVVVWRWIKNDAEHENISDAQATLSSLSTLAGDRDRDGSNLVSERETRDGSVAAQSVDAASLDVRTSDAIQDVSRRGVDSVRADSPSRRKNRGETPSRTQVLRESVGEGALTVQLKQGWAHVIIDGKALGETPLYGVTLSVGEHRVELRSPNGELIYQERVRIASGKTTIIRR